MTLQQVVAFCELVKYGTPGQVRDAIGQGGAAIIAANYAPLFGAAASNPNPEVIAAILNAGGEVNSEDEDGKTPLMFAAEKNPVPGVITALLRAGADVNAQDEDGWTALVFAAANNANPDVITVLLAAGADAKTPAGAGETALHHAQRNEQMKGTAAIRQLEEASAS